MFVYLHHVFVFLAGFVWTPLGQNVLSPMFFNPHNQRCNCDGNRQCSSDGTCSKCADPYTGITCQHASISSYQPAPTFTQVPVILRDGIESSCLTSSVQGSSVIKVQNTVHFIWVYISANTPILKTPHLELYKHGSNQSIDPVYVELDKKSILIKLKKDVMYDEIRLSALPADACTLDVSLGRNLALFAKQDQSSIYPGMPVTLTSNSLSAIDGSDDSAFNYTTSPICVLTDIASSRKEYWSATLEFDSVINSVLIVNQDNINCRMWQFEIEVFTKQKNWVSVYKDTSTRNFTGTVYIPVKHQGLVSQVKFSIYENSGLHCKGHGVISFCEVYIYGEHACPARWYGVKCEKYCTGCIRELCDPDWACKGCKKDFIGTWCEIDCNFRYGKKCENLCSTNCQGLGDCNRVSGACLDGCRPGYYPVTCQDPCKDGFYGINCSNRCSYCKKNKTTGLFGCDRVFGKCQFGCDNGDESGDCDGIIIVDDPTEGSSWKLTYIAGGLFLLLLLYKSMVIPEEEGSSEEEGKERGNPETVIDADPDLNDEILSEETDSEEDTSSESISETTESESEEEVTLSELMWRRPPDDFNLQILASDEGRSKSVLEKEDSKPPTQKPPKKMTIILGSEDKTPTSKQSKTDFKPQTQKPTKENSKLLKSEEKTPPSNQLKTDSKPPIQKPPNEKSKVLKTEDQIPTSNQIKTNFKPQTQKPQEELNDVIWKRHSDDHNLQILGSKDKAPTSNQIKTDSKPPTQKPPSQKSKVLKSEEKTPTSNQTKTGSKPPPQNPPKENSKILKSEDKTAASYDTRRDIKRPRQRSLSQELNDLIWRRDSDDHNLQILDDGESEV